MQPNLGLTTRANGDADASLQLGGVTVYAPTESVLQSAVDAIGDAIARASAAHLTLTRVTLASQVKELLGVGIEKRAFGAILGQQLRLGALDCIACAATSGQVFRIYVHEKRINEFKDYLHMARDELQRRGILEVRDLEAKVFGHRRWGTWSSAMHLLARLVQMGVVRYQGPRTFLWQAGVEHAIGQR
jgi:hypothetical protein